MLKDVLNDIDELKGSVEFSRRFLKTLETYRGRLVQAISLAETTLKQLQKGDRADTLTVESILQVVKESARFILEEEILEAVGKNREFSFPRFLEALIGVARDPRLIDIKLTSRGPNPKISVDIRFSELAGNLSDWAKGVLEAREELNVSRGIDANAASIAWREKIYQKGPYSRTIELRIDKSRNPAAFWQLLDKGTISLPSDRGGTAYPSYSIPTNFVDKAKRRIETSFTNLYRESQQNTKQEESVLQKEITLAKEYLSLIDRLVEDISTEIEKNRQLYSKFSKVATYIDQNKLDDVLVRIRRNLDIETTAEGRIELSISSSRRYRPYLSRLRSLVGG